MRDDGRCFGDALRVVSGPGPSCRLSPACNYYYTAVSAIFIASAGAYVTEWIVAPPR